MVEKPWDLDAILEDLGEDVTVRRKGKWVKPREVDSKQIMEISEKVESFQECESIKDQTLQEKQDRLSALKEHIKGKQGLELKMVKKLSVLEKEMSEEDNFTKKVHENQIKVEQYSLQIKKLTKKLIALEEDLKIEEGFRFELNKSQEHLFSAINDLKENIRAEISARLEIKTSQGKVYGLFKRDQAEDDVKGAKIKASQDRETSFKKALKENQLEIAAMGKSIKKSHDREAGFKKDKQKYQAEVAGFKKCQDTQAEITEHTNISKNGKARMKNDIEMYQAKISVLGKEIKKFLDREADMKEDIKNVLTKKLL